MDNYSFNFHPVYIVLGIMMLDLLVLLPSSCVHIIEYLYKVSINLIIILVGLVLKRWVFVTTRG